MPVNPPLAQQQLTYTAANICTDALIEIGAMAPGEQLQADEGQWAFAKLNYLIDEWAAKRIYVYSYAFNVYTLVAGLLPHTIGPSGNATFSTGILPRPVRLESAAQLLNAGAPQGPVDLPINIRDDAWWAANQVKQIQTNVVTDVYYDPTAPDGSLYFWPVPNTQNQVRLQFWQSVQSFLAITDPVGGPGGPGTLPPAYRAALMYTLAERLCPGAKLQVTPELARQALMARTALFGNNAKSPRMVTQDFGIPKAGRVGTRGDFNWVSGGIPGGRPE